MDTVNITPSGSRDAKFYQLDRAMALQYLDGAGVCKMREEQLQTPETIGWESSRFRLTRPLHAQPAMATAELT